MLAALKASDLDWIREEAEISHEVFGYDKLTVLDRDGVVVARQPDGGDEEVVGRRTRLPPELANASGTATGLRVSQIDGVARLSGFSATSGYDLVVVAGLGFREALLPWYRSVSIACGFALLYWLGLTYFVYRLSGGERLREALLDELEEQADWLDQAQRASRTGVWRIEADGERVKVSAHTAAIFGFPAEAAVLPVAQFFERVHPEDRERVEKLFAQSVVAGGPSYATEYRVSPQPGVERWIRSSGGRVADSRGQARITGTVADVTADHEAQQRVERAEAQFRALFERNPLPFWVFDAQTLRFLAVNDAAIAAYGYSQDEFRSMTILDIRPASERREVEAAMQRRDYQQDVDGVWAHLRRDGSRLDARVFSSAIEFGGRPARLPGADERSTAARGPPASASSGVVRRAGPGYRLEQGSRASAGLEDGPVDVDRPVADRHRRHVDGAPADRRPAGRAADPADDRADRADDGVGAHAAADPPVSRLARHALRLRLTGATRRPWPAPWSSPSPRPWRAACCAGRCR